jgi:AraC family transcriptional regulator
MAGYETHESFTRAFRFAYDAAPSEFRRRRVRTRAGAALPRVTLAARSGLHYDADRVDTSRLHITRGEVPMNVIVKDMPEYRVATVRHVGPYMQISQAFARLGDIAGPAGLVGRDTIMLAMYYDDPETTPPADLQSDAALTIPDDAALPDGLSESRLAAGPYATTTHVGPYEELGDVWARFMGEWLPASGRRMAEGASYEIYRNTPMDVPRELLVTELYMPLAAQADGRAASAVPTSPPICRPPSAPRPWNASPSAATGRTSPSRGSTSRCHRRYRRRRRSSRTS